MTYKTRVFLGSVEHPADVAFNDWIADKDVKIQSFEYKHARLGDHSICILYEEKPKKAVPTIDEIKAEYGDPTDDGYVFCDNCPCSDTCVSEKDACYTNSICDGRTYAYLAIQKSLTKKGEF